MCGYSSWGEFILLDNSKDNSGTKWRQDSCVLSYYILKLYILLNLDTYWTNLLDTQMKFLTSKSHFTYLLDIFNRGRMNIRLRNIMDYLLLADSRKDSIKGFKATKKYTNKNKIKRINQINKTLRMTCLDG